MAQTMRYQPPVNPLAERIGMKKAENYRRYLGRLLGLLLVLLCGRIIAKPGDITMGAKEQTFPVLETKTGAYTNVTVTKKTKDWVFRSAERRVGKECRSR